ncbi:MAG: UDP-N-acetylmuramoyl-tripeptide--D-alanyl-D-alanine ligase [Planctomycetota bacterium]|nr:MAG: UDP-N-acetylmuramoyl-tripeptide--D-alanyl-D-alanine ligase [Planctomycetota bacterium]
MKSFSITELAKIIKARPTKDTGAFTGVSTDSRTTTPGHCFFAIPGDNFDGHDYLTDAFDNGAVCAVVSKDDTVEKLPGKTLLKVDDTIKALGDLAADYRRQINPKVIAVTGSVGKTTTRQIAYHVLSQHFRVRQAPKNFNNYIGLPLTLLDADTNDQIVIAELGANHPGEIAYLTRIAQPDIAVITNVHPAHLEGFATLKTILQEKLSISQGLRHNGTLIINADCERLLEACRSTRTEFTTFGKSNQCDVQARSITLSASTSHFTIDETPVNLPLSGAGNVENALAAFSICRQFKITTNDFAETIKTLPSVPMRAEILQIGNLTVLNDCYNANPASVKNALDILVNLGSEKKQRLVFICGDMAELGKHSEKLHAQLADSITKAKVRLLLTVGDLAKVTAETAKTHAQYDLHTKSFADTVSACNNLHKYVKDYDIVLVKGSRVAKLELAVEKLKELFGR